MLNVERPTRLINLQCIMGVGGTVSIVTGTSLIDLSSELWVVFLKSHLLLWKHKAGLHSDENFLENCALLIRI